MKRPYSLIEKSIEEKANPYYAYTAACCHAMLGRKEESVAALRRAIENGWHALSSMSTEPTLESLQGFEPFERLIAGGRKEISIERGLKAGEVLEIEAFGPVSLLVIGAYVNGKPWEGWASVITPSAVSIKVNVPEQCKPAEGLEIGIEVEGPANSSLFCVVKDARLLTNDTPKTRLASGLKAYVEKAGVRLQLQYPEVTLASKCLSDLANGAASDDRPVCHRLDPPGAQLNKTRACQLDRHPV